MSRININIALIIILLLVITTLLLVFFFPRQDGDFSYQMYGKIVKIENSVVTIDGIAYSSKEGSKKNKPIVLEAVITSETVFLKKAFNLSALDERGTPIRTEPGKVTDLAEDISVSRLISKENLFEINKTATAVQVEYLMHEYSQ